MNVRWRKGITAGELMAELANDPEYQAARRVEDLKRERLAHALRVAEQPVLADLADAGYSLTSVWDLVNTSVPYPDALPILLDHLQRDYPPRVKESIARALAVRPAAFAWPILKREFLKDQEEDSKDGLAVALAATVTPDREEEYIDLVEDSRHGSSRILLLRGLKNLRSDRSREVLERLRTDEVLGKEARHQLRRRR